MDIAELMKTIKGPAIFLAQFMGPKKPFNSLEGLAKWAASLGYKGVQIPTWDSNYFNLAQAAKSKDYCDEVRGAVEGHGDNKKKKEPPGHSRQAVATLA